MEFGLSPRKWFILHFALCCITVVVPGNAQNGDAKPAIISHLVTAQNKSRPDHATGRNPEETAGGVPLAAWCCSPTLLSLTVIAVAALFLQRWWQARKMRSNLSPEEIKEFLEGNEGAAKKLDVGAEQAMLLPFKLRLEPADIVLDPARDSVLGSGNFGVVYRGFYKCETIAMKTFKRTVETEEFRAVLAETKIMAYTGRHEHVVKFIGADVSNIADRKLVLVTELSPYGDLLHYLRKIDTSYWQPEKGGCTPDGVSPRTLPSWCTQIAAGMEHLEAKKIVHGDLAARNILVFKDGVVKITDFGLSKQLYANSEYFIKRKRMLPWKWAALELLTQREFSTDSDIWAFGVTAWEIFSLGREPYEELDIGLTFIQHLEKGNRLRQPKYATHGIYEMLLECWNISRPSRPRFAILREFFGEESKQFRVDITRDLSVNNYTNV